MTPRPPAVLLLAGVAIVAALLAACDAPAESTSTSTAADTGATAPASPTPTPQASTTAVTTETAPPAETPASISHDYTTEVFEVPAGSAPHDVAPAPDGTVWFTAQGSGHLGRLDPETGESRMIALGEGSRPHGVIVGPGGHAWVTDGGLNAIVRVGAETEDVTVYPLPEDQPNANLNTAAFDGQAVLWFTGQSGIYGRFDPQRDMMEVFDAPRGAGPYGIAATPFVDGVRDVYYASLAGNHIARIDVETGEATPIDPPTAGQGARRVWSDSAGAIWVSEWRSGQVSRYDPATEEWDEWRLPGDNPQTYAVYVDERDIVWLSDFGANALVWFDPRTEEFGGMGLPEPGANVRQILGRPGEVWAPLSGSDAIMVVRYE